MMDAVTLKLVGEFIAFLVAFIGGLGYLNKTLKSWLTKLITDQQESINGRIDCVGKQLTKLTLATCKNFLVRCLADLERGEDLSETEKARFHEQLSIYTELGGNSYIINRYEQLHKEGKI